MKTVAHVYGYDYEGLEGVLPLRLATQDRINFRDFLRRKLSARVGDRPGVTSEQILEAVGKSCSQLKPGDFFVFYFSGHGGQENGDKYILIPKSGGTERLSVEDLRKAAEDCSARCLFIFDCCRVENGESGEGRGGGSSTISSEPLAPADRHCPILGERRGANRPSSEVASLFACTANEKAWESESLGNGLFTKALLDEAKRALFFFGQVRFNDNKFLSRVKQRMKRYAEQHQLEYQDPERGPDSSFSGFALGSPLKRVWTGIGCLAFAFGVFVTVAEMQHRSDDAVPVLDEIQPTLEKTNIVSVGLSVPDDVAQREVPAPIDVGAARLSLGEVVDLKLYGSEEDASGLLVDTEAAPAEVEVAPAEPPALDAVVRKDVDVFVDVSREVLLGSVVKLSGELIELGEASVWGEKPSRFELSVAPGDLLAFEHDDYHPSEVEISATGEGAIKLPLFRKEVFASILGVSGTGNLKISVNGEEVDVNAAGAFLVPTRKDLLIEGSSLWGRFELQKRIDEEPDGRVHLKPSWVFKDFSVPELGMPLIYVEDSTQCSKGAAEGFWLGQSEVTVGDWKRFVLETGYRSVGEREKGIHYWNGYSDDLLEGKSWKDPGFEQADEHPVVGISYQDALAFSDWLTKREKAEGRLPFGFKYSLPSESYWGIAAAQNVGPPWDVENSGGRTHQVSKGNADGFGFGDMLGNAWEMCLDRYLSWDIGQVGSLAQGSGEQGEDQDNRIAVRGGGWNSSLWYCAVRSRSGLRGDQGRNDVGFRLCLFRER